MLTFVMSLACLSDAPSIASHHITTYDAEDAFNETTVLYSLSNWRILCIITIITNDSLGTCEQRAQRDVRLTVRMCVMITNKIGNNTVIAQ